MPNGSFTSSTTSTEMTINKEAHLHIADGGSFDGTIKVQRKMDGDDWVDVVEITEADLPYDKIVQCAGSRIHRLSCSTYTAGTANYYFG